MRRTLIVLLLAASILPGCGSSPRTSGEPASRHIQPASLVLDFTPNAVHTGIYSAMARHYDLDAGVRLHVISPSASTDSIKLLEAGKVNFAILDIHDLAIARERGEDIVGIMAIVERPLAAVIAQPGIADPKQLQGQLVGVTGAPSDTAVLNSIVSGAGGDPGMVKRITIGFNAVPDLLAGKVKGATAFWNDEGVALKLTRPGFQIFRVDAYGAPPYPELVLCATRSSLHRDPSLARGVVGALVRGYTFTVHHPAASSADLESRVPGLSPALVKADLAVLRPAFIGPSGAVGELDPGVLQRWARWEAKFGVVRRAPDVRTTFDSQFLPSG